MYYLEMIASLIIINVTLQFTAMSSQITDKSLKACMVRQVAEQWCKNSHEFSYSQYKWAFEEYFTKRMPKELVQEIADACDQRTIHALQAEDDNALDNVPKRLIKKHINSCISKGKSEISGCKDFYTTPLYGIIFDKSLCIEEKIKRAHKLLSLGAGIEPRVKERHFREEIAWACLDFSQWESLKGAQLLQLLCQHRLSGNQEYSFNYFGTRVFRTLLQDAIRDNCRRVVNVFCEYGADRTWVIKKSLDKLKNMIWPGNEELFIKKVIEDSRAMITRHILEYAQEIIKQINEQAARMPTYYSSSIALWKDRSRWIMELLEDYYYKQHRIALRNNVKEIITYQPILFTHENK